MPNLFDDAPSVAGGADNLFADAPDLAPKTNLFEDAPLDPSSPAGQQDYLKKREQIPTPSKMLLGAELGAAQGVEELKRSAGGILRSGLTASPVELGIDLWNSLTGGTKNPITETKERIGKSLSDSANKEINQIEEASQELSPRMGVQIPKMLSSGIVSTAPSLVTAPFLGLKGSALAAGLQSFGSTYDTAYRKYAELMPPEEAKRKAMLPAIASGLVTAGATRVFGGLERMFEKLGAGQLGKETVGGLLKEVFKSASLEIPEETIDQLGQGFIEQKSFNPDKPWKEIIQESLVAGALGGGIGLLLGGIAAPSGAAINRLGRGQRLRQLRSERSTRPPVNNEEEIRQSMLDSVTKTLGNEGVTDAQRISQTEPVHENVLRPEIAPEGQGQVPPDEGSVGVPTRGQGTFPEEARAVEPVAAPPSDQALNPPPEPAQEIPTPPSPVSAQPQAIPELDALVGRREAIKNKLLADPMTPLSIEERRELVQLSAKIHELDPNRTEPASEVKFAGQTQVVPEIEKAVSEGTTVAGLLERISATETDLAPLARRMLEKADPLGRDVPVRRDPDAPTSKHQPGYRGTPDEVVMSAAHAGSPQVGLHEATHALTTQKLPVPLRVKMPTPELYRESLDFVLAGHKADPRDPATDPTIIELVKLYKESVEHYARQTGRKATDIIGHSDAPHYGFSEFKEFMAEAMSNPEFQAVLKKTPVPKGKQTVWQRFVGLIRKLLGLEQKYESVLDRVLDLTTQVAALPRVEMDIAEAPSQALVTDPSRRQDELVAQSEIPQGQVDLINHSVWSQNFATVGHADQSFHALPPEIQGHLPNIRSRFPVMYDAQAGLGGQAPQGDLSTMVGAATADPTEQQTLYFDAWQNVAEILNDRIKLNTSIESARNELESESKKGGTANNPVQELISNAAWNEINNLIGQRNAVIAQQGNPSGINQRIDELKQWMHETVFFRVATAIVNGQPLNFAAIGVDPNMGAIAAQTLASFPGLQAGIAKAKAAPAPQNIADLQSNIANQEAALQWLDQLIASPEFQTNYKQAADATGALLRMIKEDVAETSFLNPLTDEMVPIMFSAEDGVLAEQETKLLELLNAGNTYLAQAERDPLREAGVRNMIRQIEELFLNPSFSPSLGGKAYVGSSVGRKLNPFNLFTFGGILATPESRLERAGDRSAVLAQADGQAYGFARQMLDTRYKKMAVDVTLKVNSAVKGHRKDSRPITSHAQWERQISDPVIASWQETGSRHLKTGMKVYGRTITAADMDAIQAQKNFVDAIARLPSKMRTQMMELVPLKIEIGGEGFLHYYRDPQATGGLTMPRYLGKRATLYANEWLAMQEIKDPVQRRQKFMDYLGGTGHTQPFIDVVMGHLNSAAREPSYSRLVKTPYLSQYRTMAQDYHDGNSAAPTSVSKVIEFIFRNQSVADERLQTEERIADTLFDELTARFVAFGAATNAENSRGMPRSDVEIVSSDNFLTTPRGEQILPSTLYEYSIVNRDQHARPVNAVLEVLGQRFTQSLQAWERTLDGAIKKFDERITALQLEGKTAAQAQSQVQSESRQAHLDGQHWYDYNEAHNQLSQARIAIEWMRKIQTDKHAMDNAALKTGMRNMRAVIGVPLLENPLVVTRNYFGGILKLIQADMQTSHAIRIFGNSRREGINLPLVNFVVAPIKRTVHAALDIATGGSLPALLANKFFEGKLGQAMERQMQANPNAFTALGRILYDIAQKRASRYTQLESLGVAGGAPIGQSIQAYLSLFPSGGQIRKEGGSIGGGITSALGLLSEPFRIVSGAKLADTSVNQLAGFDLNNQLGTLQENALLYLSRRTALGHSSTEMLTPEELVGNRYATRKNAVYLRNRWQKAGMNIDKKMVDYFKAVKAAQANGQPWKQIQMLTDAEYHSLFMVYANEINKGGFMNRPEWLTATEAGRTLGLFRGYGLWDNAKVRTALSQFSKSKDPLNTEAVATVMGFLFIAIPWIAAITAPLLSLLAWWFFKEERQIANPLNAETPADAAKAMMVLMAPFEPIVGGAGQSIFTGVTKGGKTSIDFIPLTFFDSTLNTIRAAAQTGDPVRPTLQYVRQWWPNTRIALNRLPINEGLTEYYNVNRSLRANTPSDIEYRQSGGGVGSYKFSSTSDNSQNVVNALTRPNGPDWELAMRERALGIAEKARQGARNPAQAFDASVRAKMPYNAVYGRKLTNDEVGRIESRLSETQLGRLRRVNSAFAGYAQRTGRVSTRRSRGIGTRTVGRRLRGRLGGTARLRGLRRRSLRSSLRR